MGDQDFKKHLLSMDNTDNTEEKKWKVSNLTVLYVTAALFGGFVIAEVIGALVISNNFQFFF
jgi:hypothetical protein